MNELDRLEKQISFILEADKSKNILRQSYIADGSKREDDSEHSWHLALMAMILNEHSNKDIDLLRVIEMVIIHDLVEIDAGDTYAYDSSGNGTKRAREVAAAERIFNILPEDQAEFVRALWDEFEEGNTKEALFALSLDKIQPILLNDAAGGKTWRDHGIDKSQIIERNRYSPKGSQELWKFAENLIEQNVSKGNIKESREE